MKIVLFILLSILQLDATSIKEELIPNGYISKDKTSYKNADLFDFSKETFKDVTIKLKINKKHLDEQVYYIKVFCNTNDLITSNVAYEKYFDKIIFKLEKSSPQEVYFDFSYKKEQKLNFRLSVYNNFEYKYLLKNENLIYGIAYGIVFCAILYNFVLFLYTLQKSFLYYSLMQFFLILVLIDIVYLLQTTYFTPYEQMVIDILETSSIFFTLLFSKEILNTKKTMKFIDKVLNFLVYINIVDLIFICIFKISLLYSFLPMFIVVGILFLSGIYAFLKGQKTAIIYTLGWLVLFISILISEYRLLEISSIYVLFIGLPIESLILSFALGYKLKQTVDEKKEKEKILVHQSKLASMGEMINNIAHQWRQPLTHLSFINMDLQIAYEHNELDKKYLTSKLEESNGQIEFMSQTIDNFKDFYKPKQKKEFFYISEAIEKSIEIIKPSLDFSNIKLKFIIINDKKINSYENRYSQVILNFLTNAKDALLQRKIQNPEIEICIDVKNNKSIVKVFDNAQGIEEKYFEKIFEPYFTTKNKSTGIGLYMSKMIVEKHLKGEIKVFNTLKGACFCLEV